MKARIARKVVRKMAAGAGGYRLTTAKRATTIMCRHYGLPETHLRRIVQTMNKVGAALQKMGESFDGAGNALDWFASVGNDSLSR